MVELTVRCLLQGVSVYCDPCHDAHMFSLEELRIIIWVLQAEATDAHDTATDEADCLDDVLSWGSEPEMYDEHIEAMLQRQIATNGIECPYHSRWSGPHHSEECHLFDDEEDDDPAVLRERIKDLSNEIAELQERFTALALDRTSLESRLVNHEQ